MRPTNALIKKIQQNDPRRFHTRVRKGKTTQCAGCGAPDDKCRCVQAAIQEEES